MGQAKKRGTFEERKASAIHDLGVVVQMLEDQQKAWWDSLPKEDQKKIILKRTEQLCALQSKK